MGRIYRVVLRLPGLEVVLRAALCLHCNQVTVPRTTVPRCCPICKTWWDTVDEETIVLEKDVATDRWHLVESDLKAVRVYTGLPF